MQMEAAVVGLKKKGQGALFINKQPKRGCTSQARGWEAAHVVHWWVSSMFI
jgi:hypothetical protein